MGKHLRSFKHILISIALILLHPVLMSLFKIREAVPDFTLIWLSLLCLQYRRKACTGWGFALGLLMDMTSGGLLGLHAFSMSIAGYVGSLISGMPHPGKSLSIRLTLMAILSLQDSLVPVLFHGLNSESGAGLLMLRYGVPSFVYTLVLGMVCHIVFIRFETRRKGIWS